MFKTRVIGAWKCKVSQAKLLDTAKACHFGCIYDELLKVAYCHMTVDRVDN
jgi:hypothetical protein